MKKVCGFVALCLLLADSTAAAEPDEAEEIPAVGLRVADGWQQIDFLERLQLEPGGERQLNGVRLRLEPEAPMDREILIDSLPLEEATRKLLADIPVRAEKEAVRLGEHTYPGESSLIVRIPETERWVVIGTAPSGRLFFSALDIIQILTGRAQPLDYRLRLGFYRQRRGSWRRLQGAWATDPASEHDDMARREAAMADLVPRPGRAVVLKVPPHLATRAEIASLADRLDSEAAAMASRLPMPSDGPWVEIVIEPDLVTMGRYLEVLGEAVPAADGTLHLVPHPDDFDAQRWGVARALVRHGGLAADLSPWIIDGAALWLSRSWYGRDYEEWLSTFAAADVLPTVEQLLTTETQSDESPILWVPVAAEVVRRLPGETLRQKLARGVSRKAIEQTLKDLAKRPAPAITRAANPGRPPVFRGVSFAHAPGLETGYTSPQLDGHLERLRQVGFDSVALMPFAAQRAGTPKISFLRQGASTETDLGMLRAARLARAQGMRILWKPHIWVRGSWPGEIEMDSDASWAAWWNAYRRYILHHAVLAQHAGAEVFCVGVELGKTLGREREWRQLIRGVRRVFTGQLTYAGNWWGDYDRVPFWDALDLLGVDAYYPLAESETASAEELLAGARKAVAQIGAVAEKTGKPVILTELGYPARRGAWNRPHEEGGEPSTADQDLAYRTFFEALGRPPWLAGLFLWKVMSHAERIQSYDILDRPAETTVRDYLGDLGR